MKIGRRRDTVGDRNNFFDNIHSDKWVRLHCYVDIENKRPVISLKVTV